MATVRISEKTLVAAMQSDQTRAALKERAERIAGNATTRISAHRMKADVERTDGTRPKGRPYSRIALNSADGDHEIPPLVRRTVLEHSL